MRAFSSILIAVGFVVVAVLMVWVRTAIRRRSPKRHYLLLAGGGCLAIFILVNVTDWPGTVLATFWADHAIVAATASTLPLLGVGYFIFEAHELAERQEGAARAEEERQIERALDEKVAATGRSGLVDHLVDVDVVLALLSWHRDQVVARWPQAEDRVRPLTWLRHQRELLGPDLSSDPRTGELTASPDFDVAQGLLDQAIRRVMSGIKEWGPVLAQSEKGKEDLVKFGQIRIDLLQITAAMHQRAYRPEAIRLLQQQCRELAYRFDVGDSTISPRREVWRP